jgi:hypothetical protein
MHAFLKVLINIVIENYIRKRYISHVLSLRKGRHDNLRIWLQQML